jgi:hypothetical protein
LYKRAQEGKPTFVAGEEYLRSKQAVADAVKEIIGGLNEELVSFNAEVGLFDDGNMLRSQIIELKSLLSPVQDAVKDVDQGDLSQVKERWDGILVDVENKVKIIRQALLQIGRLRTMLEKIQGLNGKVLSELESFEYLLRLARSLCGALLSTARSSYRAGDGGPIQRWCKAYFGDIEMVARETLDGEELLSRVNSPFLNYFNTTMRGDYRAFKAKYGFGFDDVMHTLTDVTTALGSQGEKGLASFLRELPKVVRFLHSVDIPRLTMYESFKRIESELKVKPWGIDIFDAINMLLLNRTRFSLMLEPPSPELQLGVEDA